MTFQPGHNLSPGRRPGSRNKRTEEIFNRLEDRGDKDPADLLSEIVTSEKEPKELRVQAANFLMPYKSGKCGTIPAARFIPEPIEAPEFTHLSDAEAFLAKIAALVARGELDIQTGLELSSLAKAWIDAQYQREELQIKQFNSGTTEHEQVLTIRGGLPVMPGLEGVVMPAINSHPSNGHALAPPEPAVPAIKSVPKDQEAG